MNTIRWLGMILIAGASVSVGFGAALRIRQTTTQLGQLANALEVMRCELEYAMTPLLQLCQVVAKTSKGAIHALFVNLGQALTQDETWDTSRAMRQAIAQTKTLCLPEDILFSLLEMGQTMGKFDLDGQLSMLEMTQKRIQACLERYQRDQAQRCRSYQALGLCAGAALIVLML